MNEQKTFPITPQDYQQKRYEVAHRLLASIITFEKLNSMTEHKQRESFVFGCIQLSDVLLSNLGYVATTPPDEEGSKLISISDLMKEVNKS